MIIALVSTSISSLIINSYQLCDGRWPRHVYGVIIAIIAIIAIELIAIIAIIALFTTRYY